MPRLLVFLSAILVSACVPSLNASAISGTYGTTYGCWVAAHGGREDTSGPAWDFNWLVVTPHRVIGHEFDCSIRSIKGGKATLSCYVEGFKPSPTTVGMVESASGTLAYSFKGATTTLHRCQ